MHSVVHRKLLLLPPVTLMIANIFSAYVCPDDEGLSAVWWACQSLMTSLTTAYVLNNPSDQDTLGTETVSTTRAFNVAYPLQIRWVEADFVTFPDTIRGTKTATSPGLDGSNSVTAGSEGNGGLSQTAVIALSTVLSLVAIILAVPGAILAWKKLSRKSKGT